MEVSNKTKGNVLESTTAISPISRTWSSRADANPATVLDRETEPRAGSKPKNVLHMEPRTGFLLPVATPWALGSPIPCVQCLELAFPLFILTFGRHFAKESSKISSRLCGKYQSLYCRTLGRTQNRDRTSLKVDFHDNTV
jgi:hypothetical protein